MIKQRGLSRNLDGHKGLHSLMKLGFGFALLALSGASFGLGLGELQLNSALNEKLDAQARLLEVRDLTESEILIELADPEAFELQGIERSFFLTNIKYKVDLDARGGPVVRLTSTQPVREPFLEFILQARWPSGKLLRQYTVLLDLPIYADTAPAPASPVQTETLAEAQPSQRPRQTAPKSSGSDTYDNPRSRFDVGQGSARTGGVSRSSYEGDEYAVQDQDTLWEIALSVRPSRDVSVHQMMIALQEANPDAFINGNINLLKAGKILRIPDQDYVSRLNQRDAVREVVTQTQDWAGSSGAAPLEASTLDLDISAPESAGQGRLSLLSPDASIDAQSGQVSGGSDSGGSGSESLRRELAATEETLDQTRGENTELRKKIDSLEEQISTLESMIEISNENLRAMELAAQSNQDVEALADELGIDNAEQGVDSEADSEVETEESAAEDGDAELLETDADSELSNNSSELIEAGADAVDPATESADGEVDSSEAEPEVAPKPTADPTKVVYSAPADNGILTLLKEYAIFVGLGVLALLVGLFLLFKRRQNKDEDDFDDFLNQDFEPEHVDAEQDDVLEDLQDDAVADALDDQDDLELEGETEELDTEAVGAETEDVVAESDIYIAYGKYDQAEEMLKKALLADPSHHQARLKLLEIYANQENIDAFDPEYAALVSAKADADTLEKAQNLRASISVAEPFDEAVFGLADNSNEETEANTESDDSALSSADEFELDLDDNSGAETELDLDTVDLDIGELSPADSTLAETDLAAGDTEIEAAALDDIDIDTGDLPSDNLDDDFSIDLDDELDLELTSKDKDLDFDLEGLDFDVGEKDSEQAAAEVEIKAASAEDALLETDTDTDTETNAAAPEISTLDDDIDLEIADIVDSIDEGSTDDLVIEASSELEGSDLQEVAELASDDIVDLGDELISESELSAPSLQDELQDDLEAIDLDLDSSSVVELDQGIDEALGVSSDRDVGDSDIASSEDAPIELELDEELAQAKDDVDLESLDAELAGVGLDDLDEDSLSTSTFAAVDEELQATFAEGEQVLAEIDADVSADDDDDDLFESEASSEAGEDNAELPEFEEFDGFADSPDASDDKSEETVSTNSELELPDLDPESGDDKDLDFLAGSDEVSTKLDLAEAYVDMGDHAGAREILDEVMAEGGDKYRAQAQAMLDKLD